ncbi:MAG: inositol monophosphatase family protein [Ignavibacteria bacterium]
MQAELALAKVAVGKALRVLSEAVPAGGKLQCDGAVPREMKAAADVIAEAAILECLRPSGLGYLSEEAGRSGAADAGELRWIIDPLDGTVNFVRGIAPSAVSLALWRGDEPVFGVIGEYPSGRIAWGGPAIGAFLDDQPLRVSDVGDKGKAVLCTGFPARFDFSEDSLLRFVRRIEPFGKIRMLGAASLSLLQVAKGAADAYAEQDIMIWDVAAGLAIVRGAGGRTEVAAAGGADAVNVFAGNGRIAM